jgi:hypothetical protein
MTYLWGILRSVVGESPPARSSGSSRRELVGGIGAFRLVRPLRHSGAGSTERDSAGGRAGVRLRTIANRYGFVACARFGPSRPAYRRCRQVETRPDRRTALACYRHGRSALPSADGETGSAAAGSETSRSAEASPSRVTPHRSLRRSAARWRNCAFGHGALAAWFRRLCAGVFSQGGEVRGLL